MTPERKKWWGNLPQREKILRKQIEEAKSEISYLKFSLLKLAPKGGRLTDKYKKWIISQMKEQKAILTALKHELDRTTVMTFTGRYEGALAIYRCEKCGGTFENFGQSHCCWCGRKIDGCK